MIDGLLSILNTQSVIYMFVGVLVGIAVGALPGFTATMATALVLPFTFVLDPAVGIGMLGALYVAAMYADAVPACLVNTPGTPSAMTTAFDGFPLTQQGEGQKALVGAAFGSWVGATTGGLMFLLLAAPLADLALNFGPPEFFWIGVFAVTIIGSIAGKSLLKGVAGGVIGMLISTMGLSTTGEVARYTFGIPDLRGGVALVAVLIGIFAVPQMLSMVSRRRTVEQAQQVRTSKGVTRRTVREILGRPVNVIRSSVIGGAVGTIPGAGGPVAALVSYNEAMRWSKDRQQFGKGSVHGVVASEGANSAAAGGSLVPMMTLGIPGSGPAAVIMGALLLQGIQPGPRMLTTSADIVYGFAWAIVIAGALTFIIGSIVAIPMSRMVTTPVRFLVPIILLLSVIGSYAIRSNLPDTQIMLVLGISLYFLAKLDFHPGPVGLGFILGPIVEPALVQSIALVRASSVVDVFFGRLVSIVIIVLTLLSVAWVVWSRHKDRRLRVESEVPTAPPVDQQHGRTVSRGLLSGLVTLGVGSVFLANSGTEPSEWSLPLMLSGSLVVIGICFLIQSAMGRGGGSVPIVPAILRGKGTDVGVVIAIMVGYVSLIEPVGFWFMSVIVMFGVSLYLANRRGLRAAIGSGVMALVVTGLAYLLMLEVFYVPFPEFQLFGLWS